MRNFVEVVQYEILQCNYVRKEDLGVKGVNIRQKIQKIILYIVIKINIIYFINGLKKEKKISYEHIPSCNAMLG